MTHSPQSRTSSSPNLIPSLLSTSSAPPIAQRQGKRKLCENDILENSPATPKKRKKNKKRKVAQELDMDYNLGLNLSIGKLDSPLLADFVAQRTQHHGPHLSPVELEDLRIPEKAFQDTSDWGQTRTLENMTSFLDHYSSKAERSTPLSSASKSAGAPHTLVITSAGLRAANITRILRVFQTKDAVVAKLFAKHIKLKEAIAHAKQTRMGIGVGTPSRIIDLLSAGALSTSQLERIVVDCSHIDQKKRGIFDMRETQQPLMHLLNHQELKHRYGSGKGEVQLLLY